MPHKRAKRSVRDTQTKESGFNNAPSGYRIDNEQLPKGAMRVLMGGQIQAAYRDKKKRKRGDSDKDEEKNRAEEVCTLVYGYILAHSHSHPTPAQNQTW